ncbi:MAG TPA: redoxin family protein [Fimbriimonadaceae bacterium]|nr:redoxin family protein [Fimbriimonadaceae bacterium]
MHFLIALASICAFSQTDLPEQPLKPTTIRTTDGKALQVPNAKRITVLMFLMPDCPIANRYAPELKRLAAEFKKDVDFVAVYPDSDLTPESAAKHAKDFGLPFPTTLDGKLTLVKATGATVSPEAAVIAKNGKVMYRGRIDDLYTSHGTRKATVSRRDLAVALQEVIAGKQVSKPAIAATGCFLPQK